VFYFLGCRFNNWKRWSQHNEVADGGEYVEMLAHEVYEYCLQDLEIKSIMYIHKLNTFSCHC